MNDPRGSRMSVAAARFGVLAMLGSLAWGSTTAVSGVLGCKQEPIPVRFDGGAKLGYCSGYTAMEIPASECASGCSGGAYALCNGTTFDECACDLPSTYSLDAGTYEADIPLIDEGGLTAFTPDADIGLPCCTGNTVVEIPAVDCPSHCAGPIGYAVCHNDSYSECACSIPTGFTLADITCDGG